eukprot:3797057-Prymnesium_polylepis.1
MDKRKAAAGFDDVILHAARQYLLGRAVHDLPVLVVDLAHRLHEPRTKEIRRLPLALPIRGRLVATRPTRCAQLRLQPFVRLVDALNLGRTEQPRQPHDACVLRRVVRALGRQQVSLDCRIVHEALPVAPLMGDVSARATDGERCASRVE